MKKKAITVAIDAMGGDFGLEVTIPAVLSILSDLSHLHIILVGQKDQIQDLIPNHPFGERLKIQHASQKVMMDELPQSALRHKKDSSMSVAINLVKDGVASACISAGNTGALMAIAKFVLKTLPSIDRPAIAAIFPSQNGQTYVLDLGANAEVSSEQLFQFAAMGSVWVNCLTGKQNPTIGLLNIGSEEIKGNETHKMAVQLLKKSSLNFHGNVEGNDIYSGKVDIVVCDGFVGNVALKASEGLALMVKTFLLAEFQKNILRKIAALLCSSVLKAFKRRFDPGRYNGASFLGINGIVVKSHGGANVPAFRRAIQQAVEMVENDLLNKIKASFY